MRNVILRLEVSVTWGKINDGGKRRRVAEPALLEAVEP